MKLKILLTILLIPLLSFTSIAEFKELSFEEKIASMRAKYLEEKQRQDILEKINNEQELINAYTSIVSSRRKCDELGIDCVKGEGFDNIHSKLRIIDDEKKLIKAQLSLKAEREKCLKAGINCSTGKKLPKTKVKIVKKPIFNPKQEKIPDMPTVIGYLDNSVLLQIGSGEIKPYNVGDKLANGLAVKSIFINRMVYLTYKNKDLSPIE